MSTEQITAAEATEGMTIPALDNAYIVEVEPQDGYLSTPGGTYPTRLDDDFFLITYHTAEGREAYLLLPGEHPLTISRDLS